MGHEFLASLYLVLSCIGKQVTKKLANKEPFFWVLKKAHVKKRLGLPYEQIQEVRPAFPLEKNSLKLSAGDSLYDGDLHAQSSSSSEWHYFDLFLSSYTD